MKCRQVVRLLRFRDARYAVRMTTVRRTCTARLRVASVMRRQHARKQTPAPDTRTPLAKRLDEMEREGTLVPPKGIPQGFLEPVARVPGALARFLDERHYRSPLPGLAGFLDERHYTSTLTGEEEEGQ